MLDYINVFLYIVCIINTLSSTTNFVLFNKISEYSVVK